MVLALFFMAGNEKDVFREKIGQHEKRIIYSLGELHVSLCG